MPRALVDTTVLFAAAHRRDSAHEDALPILQGIDTGALPEAVVLEYVLAETLNGLTTSPVSTPRLILSDTGNATV
jgi:predicted nucleic acid-binding protein